MFNNIPDDAVTSIENRLKNIELRIWLIVRMLSLVSEKTGCRQSLIDIVSSAKPVDVSDESFSKSLEYVKKTILFDLQETFCKSPLNPEQETQ